MVESEALDLHEDAGGGPSHHFDPEHYRTMEAWRREIFPAEAALADFLDRDDLRLADVGSGPGFYAVPAARRLGRGLVYAIDHQADMVDMLRQRAAELDLGNLTVMRGEAEALPLSAGSMDAVLMANVFHDLADQEEALSQARRVLRPSGVLYLIEWEPGGTESGPPAHLRIPSTALAARLSQARFSVAQTLKGPGPFYRVLAHRM